MGLKDRIKKKMAELAQQRKEAAKFKKELKEIEDQAYKESLKKEATKIAKKRGKQRARAAARKALGERSRFKMGDLRKIRLPNMYGGAMPIRRKKKKEGEKGNRAKGIA